MEVALGPGRLAGFQQVERQRKGVLGQRKGDSKGCEMKSLFRESQTVWSLVGDT